MYKLDEVVKTYKRGHSRVEALRGVDLEIADGEWLSIQGPTGHGKSTLLQILGLLDRPTAGTVEFAGKLVDRIGEIKATKLRARSVGFIFQTFNLIPTLTARGNVEAALVPLRVPRKERRERAEKVLKAVGLGERMGHLPSELSGGQQQRVAIARALVKEPSALLADEPTGNLDEETRDSIMELLEASWKERKLTLVIVTHDSAVAARGQRIGHLRDGKIAVTAASEATHR
ncbi:MAG TPA: ABC transporter ATP-binding protein [Trebonia sp.]|jgi:putative ABC transport system ATP-binding protein